MTELQPVPPSIFDSSTCVRKGMCPVTDIRNQDDPLESHSMYYEQHGSGPDKLVLIMGLNSSSFAWLEQVRHFSKQPDKYSVLVFDNRGVGNSGTPKGPYSTQGMAQDVITLLDFLGWKDPRSIHVIGVSLGGMISQELALAIPERIASLILAVTTPGGHFWQNFPPWKGLVNLTKVTFITDPERKIPLILEMVYSTGWLYEKASDGRTNLERQTEDYRRRIEITKPMTLIGSLSQMFAALTHYVHPTRLQAVSSSIPKVVLLTGDQDNLVQPSNSVRMKNSMPEAEFIQWKETGHGIHLQRLAEFNALIERVVEEGKERASVDQKTKST